MTAPKTIINPKNISMKKYFKSPIEAKKADPKAVTKALKKVFDKGVEGSKFFYKADFEYDNGETAPFLYIGPAAGPWKTFIKDTKRDKDFVAGLCRLETSDAGDKELKLLSKLGKGDKPVFLKAINKLLLKRLSVKAQFVAELPINIDEVEEEEDDTEDAGAAESDANETVATASQDELAEKLERKAKIVEEFAKEFDFVKSNYDREMKEKLYGKSVRWLKNYMGLDDEHKKTLNKHAQEVKTIHDAIKNKLATDNKLTEGMDKIYAALDKYLELFEAGSDAAATMAQKIKTGIDSVKKLILEVNDKELLKECEEIQELLD